MNKERRKNLQSIIDRLEELKTDLEVLIEEEEEYIGNMPENLRGSERYERAEEALSYMNDAYDFIDDVTSNIESAVEA